MKRVLYVIGVGLAAGGAVVALALLKSKKKVDNECFNCKEPEKKRFSAEEVSFTKPASTPEETKFENVKSPAIEKIYSRHKGAASIMKDSVETIRENIRVSTSINNEIDDVSAELDKMLSED